MNYTQESVLNTSDKTTLTMIFNDTISFLKHISVPKAISYSDLQDVFLNKDPSRIILTDITTIDIARLGRRIGQLKPEYLLEVGKCLKAQLEI